MAEATSTTLFSGPTSRQMVGVNLKVSQEGKKAFSKVLIPQSDHDGVGFACRRGADGSHQAGLWLFWEDEGEDVGRHRGSAGLRLGLAGLQQGQWQTVYCCLCQPGSSAGIHRLVRKWDSVHLVSPCVTLCLMVSVSDPQVSSLFLVLMCGNTPTTFSTRMCDQTMSRLSGTLSTGRTWANVSRLPKSRSMSTKTKIQHHDLHLIKVELQIISSCFTLCVSDVHLYRIFNNWAQRLTWVPTKRLIIYWVSFRIFLAKMCCWLLLMYKHNK